MSALWESFVNTAPVRWYLVALRAAGRFIARAVYGHSQPENNPHHLWDIDVRGPDECWEWLAPVNDGGYGYFWDSQSQSVVLAHRRAWERANGTITGGASILHSCDNPACCNPAHLRCGNAKDNAQDVKDHGRDAAWYMPKNGGASHGMAKLTAADVESIRQMRASGAVYTRIGEAFGISYQQAHKICTGKSWVRYGPRSVVSKEATHE